MRISVHFVGLLVAHRAASLYAEVFFDLQVCFDIGQLLLVGQIIGLEAFPIAALDVLDLCDCPLGVAFGGDAERCR